METEEKNNSESDKLFVIFNDVFRRRTLVDSNLSKNTEMHGLPTDDDTVVQESCTTSVQGMSQKLQILQEKSLSLPLQPTSPPEEQL